MLRISVEASPLLTTLRLEGKLVDPWVDELVKVWSEMAGRPRGEEGIEVDLDSVSYVDDSGKDMLAILWRGGCELKGSGPFIASVIEEITANSRQ